MELVYPITTNLITLVVQVHHLLRRECLRQGGIKLGHFRILACLVRHGEVQTVSTIATDLRLTGSTITLTLNQMERVGLIRRLYEGEDRRIVSIAPTPEGVRNKECAEQALAKLISELWEPLGPQHKQTLIRGTAKIDSNWSDDSTSYQIRVITAYVNVYVYTLYTITQAVRLNGLSLNEFRMLFELNKHPQGLRSGELGNILILSPNELTKAADSLVKKNAIKRERFGGDKRVVALEITSDGYALLSRTAPAVDDAFVNGTYETSEHDRIHYLQVADLVAGVSASGLLRTGIWRAH